MATIPETATVSVARPAGLSRPRARLLRHPLWWTGSLLVVGLVLFCFVGPWVWRVNPLAIHVAWFASPPTRALPLGADALGRDELARLMAGGQEILLVGALAALLATVGGTLAGLLAGLNGGIVDRALMWAVDVFLGVPQIVPLMLVDVLVRPTPATMTIIVALTGWPTIARLVRAETLRLKAGEFVEAARALGASEGALMRRHLLPNLLAVVLVAGSFQVGTALMVVGTASYLGVGLPPPWPNWGSMLSDAVDALIAGYWWMVVPPALAYALLQLGVNFMADAVRESLLAEGPHGRRG
jgi:peptide/nickel transport system permease protein